MPTQTGGAVAAASLALATYTACLTANQTPLAISTGDINNTPQAGTVSIAIKMLTAAGVIAGAINPVPLFPPPDGFVPAVYLVLAAWQPGDSTAAQLETNLATALAALNY